MAVASMTGFARAEGADGIWRWIWEAKSVNGRGLDVRTKLPPGCEALDGAVRKAVGDHLARGSVSLTLWLEKAGGRAAARIDRELLASLTQAALDLHRRADVQLPSADGLLALRGVIVTDEEAPELLDEAGRARRDGAMLADLGQALSGLAAARREEGARLAAILAGHVGEIEGLVSEAAHAAAARPGAWAARLKAQLAVLLEGRPEVSEDRLAQELALLATRADITEEIDRLKGHAEESRRLLAAPGAVGRQLDFLCQEFHREANTLCSKSADRDLTRIGLALKNIIDRLREQVQNIE